MQEEPLNICLDCGYEWEEKNAQFCKNCGCGDFYVEEDN